MDAGQWMLESLFLQHCEGVYFICRNVGKNYQQLCTTVWKRMVYLHLQMLCVTADVTLMTAEQVINHQLA